MMVIKISMEKEHKMTHLICNLFGDPRPVSEGVDGITYIVQFECLPEERKGVPDEKNYIILYHRDVGLTGRVIKKWNLMSNNDISNDDIAKVAYQRALESLKEYPQEVYKRIDLDNDHTDDKCPYDIKSIKLPKPDQFLVKL